MTETAVAPIGGERVDRHPALLVDEGSELRQQPPPAIISHPMEFKVFTDNDGTFVQYGGDAKYSIEGGVLTVVSGKVKVAYGPNGWTRVEAPTPEGTWADLEAQAKARASEKQSRRPIGPGANG